MGRRAENLTPVWPKVGRYVAGTARRQFTSRGAYLETPWRPLAASTRIDKRRKGFPSSPLVRTAALKREFTGLRAVPHGPRRAFFGSYSNKARWQNYGTRRRTAKGKWHIPPRTILKVTPKVAGDIQKIVAEYIVKGTTR